VEKTMPPGLSEYVFMARWRLLGQSVNCIVKMIRSQFFYTPGLAYLPGSYHYKRLPPMTVFPFKKLFFNPSLHLALLTLIMIPKAFCELARVGYLTRKSL
jgi:hypothetical protein